MARRREEDTWEDVAEEESVRAPVSAGRGLAVRRPADDGGSRSTASSSSSSSSSTSGSARPSLAAPARAVRAVDEDGEEESHSSRAGSRSRAGSSLVRMPVAGSGPSDVGTLESLQVKNFMCHANLKLDFNSFVNFIVGKNGSGKSAICAALMVGLGFRAAATGRGANIAAMIQRGKEVGEVTIRLRNAGALGYRRDVLGDRVTVVRTLRKNGASVKILNGAGGEVKGVKLGELCEAMGIMAENPLVVCTQEMAKTFALADAREKYKFFFEASGLAQLWEEIKGAAGTIEDAKGNAELARRNRDSVLEDFQRAKAEFEKMDSLRSLDEKIAVAKVAVLWAEVAQTFDEARAATDKANASARKLQKLEDEVVRLLREREDTQARLEGVSARIEVQVAKVEEAAHRVTELEARKQGILAPAAAWRAEQTKIAAEVAKQEDVVRRTERDIERRRRELEERRSGSASARALAERDRLRERISALLDESNAYEDQRVPLVDRQRRAESERGAAENALRLERRALEGARRDLTTAEELMRQADRAPDPTLLAVQRFGMNHVAIFRALKAAEHRFSRFPIGPLGRFIHLREGQSRWAAALEHAVLRYQDHWVVASKSDLRVFDDVTRSLGTHGSIRTSVIAPVSSEELAARLGHRRDDSFVRMLDVLERPEDWALYALLSFVRLDTAILADDDRFVQDRVRRLLDGGGGDDEEGDDAAGGGAGGGGGSRGSMASLTAFVPSGEMYILRRGAERRMDWVTSSGRSRFEPLRSEAPVDPRVDMERRRGRVTDAAEAEREAHTRLAAAEKEFRDASKALAEVQSTIHALERQRADLVAREARASDEYNRLAALEDESRTTDDFTAERALIEVARATIDDKRTEHARLAALIEEARAQVAPIDAELERLSSSNEGRAELDELHRETKRTHVELERVSMQLAEITRRRDEMRTTMNLLLEEAKKKHERASESKLAVTAETRTDGPADPHITVDAALSILRRLEAKKQDEERRSREAGLDYETVRKRFEEADARREKVVREFAAIEELLTTLPHHSKARRIKMLNFERTFAKKIAASFSHSLQEKGHLGTVKIEPSTSDPSLGELKLEVKPDAFARDLSIGDLSHRAADEDSDEERGRGRARGGGGRGRGRGGARGGRKRPRDHKTGEGADGDDDDHHEDDDDDEDDEDYEAAGADGTGGAHRGKRARVVAATTEVGNLSGGEKSLTSLSLLLAVSAVVDAPFKVLDEFDVFMDEPTRKIALQLLVDHARKIALHAESTTQGAIEDGETSVAGSRNRIGHQFIFITPHDISATVETSTRFISILRLAQPRRDDAAGDDDEHDDAAPSAEAGGD